MNSYSTKRHIRVFENSLKTQKLETEYFSKNFFSDFQFKIKRNHKNEKPFAYYYYKFSTNYILFIYINDFVDFQYLYNK